MADGFCTGIQSFGLPSGFERVVEGFLPILSPEPVMSEQRSALSDQGLCLGEQHDPLFENLGNSGMQLLTPTAQQGAIRGVLHEGMLEEERLFWRRAAAED